MSLVAVAGEVFSDAEAINYMILLVLLASKNDCDRMISNDELVLLVYLYQSYNISNKVDD